MTNRLYFVFSVLLCIYQPAFGGVASHQIKIIHQSGKIQVAADHARFSIRYNYSSAPKAKHHFENQPVYFQIPIWVPSDPNLPAMKEFWILFPVHKLQHVDETNIAIMKKTLAFQLNISGKDIPIGSFATFTYNADAFRMPMSWRERGFNCILFNFRIPPKDMVRGQNVDIKYKVPLAKNNGQTQFLYIPFFYHLPKNHTLKHRDDYSLTFSASENALLSPQGDYIFKDEVKPSGFSILPQHEQKIIINVKSK